MTTPRSDLDPAQQTPGPTVFKPETKQHEVRCGMCGKMIYVDEENFTFVADAIKSGLDDPFRCEECKEEYDDLAFEG